MKFKVIEVDEEGEEQNSYDDTYQLDPVTFTISDYMNPQKLPIGQFSDAWERISTNPNHVEE